MVAETAQPPILDDPRADIAVLVAEPAIVIAHNVEQQQAGRQPVDIHGQKIACAGCPRAVVQTAPIGMERP